MGSARQGDAPPKARKRVAKAILATLAVAGAIHLHHRIRDGDPDSSTTEQQSTRPAANDDYKDAFTDCVNALYGKANDSTTVVAIGLLQKDYRLVSDDAQDVAIGVLVDLCEAHSARPYSNLRAAYFQAIRNRATDRWRYRQKHVACEDPDPLSESCASPIYATDEVRLKGEIAAAYSEFCELSVLARQTLVLRALDSSFDEIATQLGITEVQARSTYHNSLRRIQVRLQERCQPAPTPSPILIRPFRRRIVNDPFSQPPSGSYEYGDEPLQRDRRSDQEDDY